MFRVKSSKFYPPLIIFSLCLAFSASAGIVDRNNDEKVIIEKKVQKLTFFTNKQKKLSAKLSVELNVVSQTNLPYKFSRSVLFDNNSEVGNIVKVADRRTRQLEPIISDYESEGIFHSDMKLCYFEHTFKNKGETASFRYEKIFKDLKFLDPLYFNDAYQVEKSALLIEVPDWVTIDLREFNFDLEQPEYTKSQAKNTVSHHYQLYKLPPAFRFSGAPRRSKINAHLIPILNAYQVKGEHFKLIESVDDLYTWYASLVARMNNNNEDLKALVEKLTTGKPTDLEKIKAIFYWVQDNIRYIAFEYGIMGFQPENCQTVFNNKYGDCKGMANLTKEMLHLAGYDARLTWLGTTDIPYDYTTPSLLVDNHMICTVILNDEKIFLDPTEKYAGLYNYAFRVQGQEALIEDGDSFMIERVPRLDASHHKESTNHMFSLEGDQLSGSGNMTFKGNRKSYILYLLSTIPENKWNESLTEYLSNGDKNVQIELQTSPSLDNRDDDFSLEYNIHLNHHIIDLGEEMYINLEADYHFQNFEMSQERNVPYEFSGVYSIETTSKLNIPDGWKTAYLPEQVIIENEKYSFNLSIKEENQQLIYHKKIEIKDALLKVEAFQSWNEAIKVVKTFYGDQIILSKK